MRTGKGRRDFIKQSLFLAGAAGVVVVLLASMVGHELAHSIMARRYGLSAT